MPTRIGLIADTHIPGSLEVLWPQALAAFGGVDVILHAGDLHTLDVIDQLEEVAPTYVALGNGDRGLEDTRLQETWHLAFEPLSVGMVHHFPTPHNRPDEVIAARIERLFDTVPHAVIYGHTHRESIHEIGGVLCINPGSPTLPNNLSTRLGTIGFLDVDDTGVVASLYQLTDHGIEAHGEIEPVALRF